MISVMATVTLLVGKGGWPYATHHILISRDFYIKEVTP
jgi:hypothetical protein